MSVSPWVALAAGTLLLAVGAAVLVNQLGEGRVPAHVAAPAAQPPAPVKATSSPTTATVPGSTAVPAPASTSPELIIPSVSLRAPLLPLKVAGARVSPPSFADAFWVEATGFGDVHQSTSPTLVAFHASTDPHANALGDLIWDRAAQRAKLQPGDRVIADGTSYRVTKTFTQLKQVAERHDPAWTAPGGLLLITCAESADAATTGRHADSNLVVVAERVP